MSSQLPILVEALLFASQDPLTMERLQQLLAEYEVAELQAALEQVVRHFEEDSSRPYFVCRVGGGYQFRSRDRYAPYVKRLFERERLRRLSPAALETLACVAYRQPITRGEIEEIRGVDCSGTLRSLLERGLVRLGGRRKTAGKPLTYLTTTQFLTLFGLESLRDLPSLDELAPAEDGEQLPLLLRDAAGRITQSGDAPKITPLTTATPAEYFPEGDTTGVDDTTE